MAKRIAVVVSQGQSASPAKRQLEEDIISALLFEQGLDLVIIPHLYDLKPDGTGMLALNGIMGNMVILSWLYERGARWTLDRFGIRGKEGLTLIKSEDDDDEDEDAEEASANGGEKERVIDKQDLPNRRIYCLDLRIHDKAQVYIDEVKRIAKENALPLVGLSGLGMPGLATPDQAARFISPTNNTALPFAGPGNIVAETKSIAEPLRIAEDGTRRWYPV